MGEIQILKRPVTRAGNYSENMINTISEFMLLYITGEMGVTRENC